MALLTVSNLSRTTTPSPTQVLSAAALREKFEKVVAAEPYEMCIERWANDPKLAWPGQYKDSWVSFAWDALQDTLAPD